MKTKFWRIQIEEGMKPIANIAVPQGQISEKGLKKLIRALFAKYVQSDEEIVSSFCNKGTKRYDGLFEKIYSRAHDGTELGITSSGISISIFLIDEKKLTQNEKIKINYSSSLKLKIS